MDQETRWAALRKQPEFARHGTKWTSLETEQIMDEITGGMELTDIAIKHQRTVGAVKIHIMTTAINRMAEKHQTIEEVANFIRIPITDLLYHKEHLDLRAQKPKKDAALRDIEAKIKNLETKITMLETKENPFNILIEIRDYLKIIAEK